MLVVMNINVRLCPTMIYPPEKTFTQTVEHSTHLLPSLMLAVRVVIFAVASAVTHEEIRRRRRLNRRRDKLTRKSNLLPHVAPTSRIFLAQQDSAYITFFGIDVSAFLTLLSPVENELHMWTYVERIGPIKGKSTRGQKHSSQPHACLACVLMWLRSKCEQRHLALHLGATPTVVSRTIHLGIAVLHAVLQEMRLAAVQFPSPDECDAFRRAVAYRYPLLD